MQKDRFSLNDVENEVVVYDEVAVSEAREIFFLRNTAQMRVLREKGEVLLDLRGNSICSRRAVCGDVTHDFGEVVFRYPEEPNIVLRSLHGCVFGGPS